MPAETESLRELVTDLDAHLRLTWDYLGGYWNTKQVCFSTADPNSDVVNVTSTCFALSALRAIPLAERRFYSGHAPKSPSEVNAEIRNVLLDAAWTSEVLARFNAYTNPIALSGVLALGASVAHPRVVEAAAALERATDGSSVAYPDYPPNAFLTYWATRALVALHDTPGTGAVQRKRLRRALRRLHVWAESEIHRQIASKAVGDIASFDASQLAYAIAIYTSVGHAVDYKPRTDVVDHAIQIVFSAQLSDGLWPKGGPIFHLPSRGSIYSFTFEMLDVLLGASVPPELFTPYLPQLQTSVQWANDNLKSDPITRTRGWRSNHLVIDGGPEVWSTAAVFASFMRVRTLASLAVNSEIAKEYSATPTLIPDRSRLEGLLDSHLNVQGRNRSLRAIVDEHFLTPRLSATSPGTSPKYSAILFGPPGTAKTTIAGAVASALGWPFFHIQTGHFLEDGNERVAARARSMFTRHLGLLENAVILFDEIEEFILDREAAETETSSKLMTTSMLTLIQQLRREERVIFFVATNRLREIDSAIRRPGRFDMILLVQPPSRQAKASFLKQQLRSAATVASIPTTSINIMCSAVDAVIARHFDTVLRYFSFAEWKSFSADLARASQSGVLSEAAIEAVMARRSAYILIAGPIRQTFEECERDSIIY